MGGTRPTWRDGAAAACVLALVACVLVPLPALLLDALLVAQFAGGGLALAWALAPGGRPPAGGLAAGLLVAAMLRLALAVAVTRRAVSLGEAGDLVAGLGRAAGGGSAIGGAVLLLAVVAIQMLVVSRGTERVAQVAARFALDALPGRQLALEGELRTGEASAHEVRRRRERLASEVGLAGSLDGASRFVRGEAVVSLVLVGLTFVGGLLVAVVEHGANAGEASRHFLALSVGLGLAVQVPALLFSTAAGLVLSRQAEGGVDARSSSGAGVLAGGAAVCLALLAVPDLPAWLPLAGCLALGGAAAWRGWKVPSPVAGETPRLSLVLHPDAVRALAPLGPQDVVRRAAVELRRLDGLEVSSVAVETDAGLPSGGYLIKHAGATVERGLLVAGRRFRVPGSPDAEAIARHPESGARGGWADGEGLEPAAYLAAHLRETWRRTRGAVLDLEAAAARLVALQSEAPALAATIHPRRVDLPGFANLLAALQREGVPTADLRGVAEALAELPADLPPEARLSGVRRALAPRISALVAPDGVLRALCLEAAAEETLRSAGTLSPPVAERLIEDAETALARGPGLALLVGPGAREAALRLFEPRIPGLRVVTAEELLPAVRVLPVAILGSS